MKFVASARISRIFRREVHLFLSLNVSSQLLTSLSLTIKYAFSWLTASTSSYKVKAFFRRRTRHPRYFTQVLLQLSSSLQDGSPLEYPSGQASLKCISKVTMLAYGISERCNTLIGE